MRRGTELAKEQGIDNVHFQVLCTSYAHAAAGALLASMLGASPIDTI